MRRAGTHSQKEVGVAGIAPNTGLPQLRSGVSVRSGRLEGNSLHVVLEVQMDMGEDGLKRGLELAKVELVRVKRVRPGQPARLGVVVPVRRRDQEQTARRQHAAAFPKEGLPVRQVLDHFESDNQVEACVRNGHRRAGAFQKPQAGRAIVLAGVRDGICRNIDPGDAQGLLRQRGRAVARAATGIQDALPRGQAQCERIAGQVLVPEVDIDLPWDDAFPGKLGHPFPSAAEAAPESLVFSSIRHGRCVYP